MLWLPLLLKAVEQTAVFVFPEPESATEGPSGEVVQDQGKAHVRRCSRRMTDAGLRACRHRECGERRHRNENCA